MLPALCLPCTPTDVQITTENAKDDRCAICLDSLREPAPDDSNDVEQLFECQHEFHSFCIGGYLNSGQSTQCPLCRTPIAPDDVLRLVQYYGADDQQQAVVPAVAGPTPWEQAHGPGWDPTTHWTALGGWCGQSCPCCRYEVEGPNGFGVCDICKNSQRPATARRVINVVSGPKMTFLYVVAKKLGSTPNTRNVGPVLLMMGHTTSRSDPVRHEKWGVPGGLYDATDQGTLYNAVREFSEEMGLFPNARRMTGQDKRRFVKAVRTKMFQIGRIYRVAKNVNTGYSAYALVVENALGFERALRLPEAGNEIKTKSTVPLSGETKGYIWVTRAALNNVRRIRGPNGVAYNAINSPPGINHPLRLRKGVLGTQLDRAFNLA